MDWLQDVGVYIGAVVGCANVVTMSFPSVKENKIYNVAMGILNILSLNIFKNKNADHVKK